MLPDRYTNTTNIEADAMLLYFVSAFHAPTILANDFCRIYDTASQQEKLYAIDARPCRLLRQYRCHLRQCFLPVLRISRCLISRALKCHTAINLFLRLSAPQISASRRAASAAKYGAGDTYFSKSQA